MEQYLSPSGAPSPPKQSPNSNKISTPPLDIEKRLQRINQLFSGEKPAERPLSTSPSPKPDNKSNRMPLFASSQGLSSHPHADVVRKAVIGHADPEAAKTSGAVPAPTPPRGPPPGWNGGSPADERGSLSSPRSLDVENVRPSARSPPTGVEARGMTKDAFEVKEHEEEDDDEEAERPLFHATPTASDFKKDVGFTPNSFFGGASGAAPVPSPYGSADPLSAAGAYRTSGAASGATSASSSPGLYDPHARENDEEDDEGGCAGGNGENDVDAERLAEDSMDDDDDENDDEENEAAQTGESGSKFASPFKPSTAEQEYEEMLLSPAQRNRIANKRRRKVFVAVRVRPFLPHETPQEVEPSSSSEGGAVSGEDGEKRGVLAVRGKTLLLVNPAVFPGASGELVADMVLAASGTELELDLADWARPFEFNATLWSMPTLNSSSSQQPLAAQSNKQRGGAGQFCDQDQLYKELGSQLVDSLFQGVHVSAFAYGQTGSGKTYSMLGSDPLGLHLADPATFGLVPKALLDIMDRAAMLHQSMKFHHQDDDGDEAKDAEDIRSISLRLSVLEVYNDRLRDLLSPGSGADQPLKIREDPLNGPYAVNLERVPVDLEEAKEEREDSVLQLLSLASAIRVTADTLTPQTHGNSAASSSSKHGKKAKGGSGSHSEPSEGHENSSRGHVIVNVDLEVNGVTTRAQLVDLAGSERAPTDRAQMMPHHKHSAKKHGHHKDSSSAGASSLAPSSADAKLQALRNRERVEIGRSLSNLNVIINGLARGDEPASLPFRESKMTWLLKQGLAMDAHVVMLGTVSPAAECYEESLQTLQYAERLQKLRSAATRAPGAPIRKLVNSRLIDKVLEDPVKLLQRISNFQTQARAAPRSSLPFSPNATSTTTPATPNSSQSGARGLTPSTAGIGQHPTGPGLFASPGPVGSPCFNFSSPAPVAAGAPGSSSSHNSGGGGGNGNSSRKASMRGLEVSDPRQRLTKLTDFLAKKGGVAINASAATAPDSAGNHNNNNNGSHGATPLSPTRGTNVSSSNSSEGPGTPSRDRLRGSLLPTMGTAGAADSPPVPQGERLGELSRLRHANANLEMELHSVKVDRDVLELRVKECQADLQQLRDVAAQLAGSAARAEAAEATNTLLEQQLNDSRAEAAQLRHEMSELRTEAQRQAARAEATEADVLYYSLGVRAEQEAAHAEALEVQRLNDLTAAWYRWRAVVDDLEMGRIRTMQASFNPNYHQGSTPLPLALGYGGGGGESANGSEADFDGEWDNNNGDDNGRITPMERYQTPTWIGDEDGENDEDEEDDHSNFGGDYDQQGNFRGDYGAVPGDYYAAMLGTNYGDRSAGLDGGSAGIMSRGIDGDDNKVGGSSAGLDPPHGYLARSTTGLPL